MDKDELKEAVREAIDSRIPFSLPIDEDYTAFAEIVHAVAAEKEYVKGRPHNFVHHAMAFHLSRENGMRWGYVRNDNKIGWFESRETTPLPERDIVIKDADFVYALKRDLVTPAS